MNIRPLAVIVAVVATSTMHAVVCCAQEPVPKPTAVSVTPEVPLCNQDRLTYDRDMQGMQRLCIYAHNLTAPSVIFGAIGAAGYAAITNTENQQFGAGFESFSRGVATRYVQSATKSTAEYLVAWVTNEDPRASRHHGTVAHRFKAAAASLFVTSDDSRSRFKPGPLAGAAAGGFVALLWEPRNQQTVDGAFQHMGTSLAGSLAGAEFHEFEHEIMRWLSNRFEPKLK